MGVESNRFPPLPVPTETDSNLPSVPPSDLGTDLTESHSGDQQSSYSLPDDGTPVTIKTRGHSHTKSQTSLLIEYFETGKSGPSSDRKPSVRVRLTPSSKSRENDHHIKITKTKNSRKGSAGKRLPLSQTEQNENEEKAYLDDYSSCASATEESNVSRPIDVDIDRSNRRPRRPASPLIPASGVNSSRASYMQSEISAIPTDSFLDGSSGRDGKGSLASPYKTDSFVAGGLSGENMPREKPSSGRDRQVAPKTRDKERKHKSSGSKSRSSSVSERHADGVRSPRRSSRSGHQESAISAISAISAPESSVLSSQVSASQHSKLSGTSRASGSSINNPKLLETVEDAIRRLILPELNALKREQSKRGPRPESLTASSVTNTSRESRDDRSERRRSTKSTESRDSTRHHESRNREARNDLEEASSARDGEDDSIEFRVEDYDAPRRSHDKLKAATAGADVGTAGATVAGSLDQSPSDVSSKRRRRRSEKKLASKSTDEVDDGYQNGLQPPMPPMPLSSEINPSEITRTSILSADTDRPHSAMEEVSRDAPYLDSTPTPSRTPQPTLEQLGSAHANVSHGDLKQLPSRRMGERTGEFPKGIEGPVQPEVVEYDDDEEESYQEGYPGYYDQDVPAPLNYIPYQPASRGLSPIESVSGYTDGYSEVQQQRDSRLVPTGSYSPEKPEEGISNISAPSNVRSHGFEESELGSVRSSVVDNYRNTTYTDDSELDRVQSGQAVQIVGASPNFVSGPIGIESNVASLIDGSMVEPSMLGNGYNQQQHSSQESMLSFEDHRPMSAADARGMSPSSRGLSPGSPSVASRRQLFEERMESPVSRKSTLSREYQEYEPDQYGRKVPIATATHQPVESPTPSETAITGAAVGAAAAALRAAQDSHSNSYSTDIVRNKSFKERAQTRQPAATPKHSVDRFSFDGSPEMQATTTPDFNMPALGYGVDDHSLVEERLGHSFDEDEFDDYRSVNATPTPKDADRSMALDDFAAPVAAAAGTASHSRQPSQDPSEDFRRTSQDRKRETIITNPYENASPVPLLGDAHERMLGGEMANQYGAPSFPSGTPGLQQKVDEGYISQGPNRTPDTHGKSKAVDFRDQAPYGGALQDSFERRLSGMSQGMASPFFDASTGTSIDRIDNKDIIALMQHLMVRDAQRSARDTEILVTLVRTAADMRNSFDAVTKLLGDVENTVITEVQDNTDKTVRTHVGGPRPYPASLAPRSVHNGSQAGTDDVAAKKRSFLKKALKGLTVKGNNDLGRIEDMLMQLLSEVDVLKSQTAVPAVARSTAHQPSYENLPSELQYDQDRGYEPEGIAGTSTASHASQSGHLSLPQRGPPSKLGYERKFSAENRISTVHEHEDEYDDPHVTTIPHQGHYDNNSDMLMTTALGDGRSSVPLATPPQTATAGASGSMSQDHTPKGKEKEKEKGKKRGSSSWFPKISRWSETTTSSVGNRFRMSVGSSKKNQSGDLAPQPPSGSGSDLTGTYDLEGFLRTDPNGDDRVQLQTGYSDDDLTPSAMAPHPSTYMTPEDPKYHAHRDSLNLQHPQPRAGNTEKYKLALETSAQDFQAVPTSPRSGNWAGSVSSLNRLVDEPAAHYADGSHQASATQEFWAPSSLSGGPPLPPKEPLDYDGASTAKSSRVSKMQQDQSPQPNHSVESGYGTAEYTSPKIENRHLSTAGGVPSRRPSGPRAMTPKNVSGEESPDERRRKRDTFGSMTSQDSDTF